MAFREEAFCILMIASWEALLKARIIEENNGRFSSIEVWEPRKTKSGKPSKIKIRRKNRAGNSLTISLQKAIEIVRQYSERRLDELAIENLNALTEIRDNSVHLVNQGQVLHRQIHALGTASMINLLRALQNWFEVDLAEFGFVPLPVGYFPPAELEVTGPESRNAPNQRLSEFLRSLRIGEEGDQGFVSTVGIAIKFTKKSDENILQVRVTKDPKAPEVRLSEEEIHVRYPLRHKDVLKKLRARDPQVKFNKVFYEKMKRLEQDEDICRIRYLDPKRPRRAVMKFYSPAFIDAFFK